MHLAGLSSEKYHLHHRNDKGNGNPVFNTELILLAHLGTISSIVRFFDLISWNKIMLSFLSEVIKYYNYRKMKIKYLYSHSIQFVNQNHEHFTP